MHGGHSMSADGAISAFLAFLIAVLTILSLLHHTRQLRRKYGHVRAVCIIYDVAAVARKRLLSIITRTYELRFVSLWLLLAMIVATVSPVATMMEIEGHIIAKSCINLQERGLIDRAVHPTDCKRAAATEGFTYVEGAFGETKSHFLQVALWPALIVVYGFLVSMVFALLKAGSNRPIEELAEELPHVYHAFVMLLSVLFYCVRVIQDFIGT